MNPGKERALEKSVRDLSLNSSRNPLRPARGGGGGGGSCQTVETLPAIPASGRKRVFWTSAGSGTGDDQVWEAHASQSRWYPQDFPTDKSGDPPS